MIRYKKYQVTGEDSPLKGLWYARPVIEETFDIEKLAKHMSNHNTWKIQCKLPPKTKRFCPLVLK